MSTNIDRDDVLAAMRGIEIFKDVPPDAIRTERLGGLTNRNFRIDSPRGHHVLRIPGAGTSEYINRHNEAHAAKSAAKVGVNADVVHFDERTGVMLCRYVDGGVTMNADRFKDLGSVKRSAVALKRVHDGAAPFLNRFELFQMINPSSYHGMRPRPNCVLVIQHSSPV